MTGLSVSTEKYISTNSYENVHMKQISITLPEALLKTSSEFAKEQGYRNVQELILELLRRKVKEQLERYAAIEKNMKGKTYSQSEALEHLDGM